MVGRQGKQFSDVEARTAVTRLDLATDYEWCDRRDIDRPRTGVRPVAIDWPEGAINVDTAAGIELLDHDEGASG
jgi:hypothetical protein